MMPVKSVEKELMELYVMKLPCNGLPAVESAEAFVTPVMEREGVILLALLTSFLPSKWIQQGQDGDAEALFGPSVEVMVQAMEEDEAGQEVLLEIEIPCLLLQPIDSASFETFRSGDRRRCSVSWKALLICCL